MSGVPEVSRRVLRHLIVRRLNERVAESRDGRMPLRIYAHPDTITELLIDSDPNEVHTVDFEGKEFMGIPLLRDTAHDAGIIHLIWPDPEPAAPAPTPPPPPLAPVDPEGGLF